MPLLILIAALAFAASPLWVPDFGGFDPEQFPIPQNDPPVQPAGYAFAIWGLIYVWLIASAVFGFLARRTARDWEPMRLPHLAALAVGAIWLRVAVESPVWAAVLIWVMLIAALTALFRTPVRDRHWAEWPIGLFAGWLSAASPVAIGLLLAGYGWTSEAVAAWSMLLIAIFLGFAIQWRLARAPTYGAAIIWALIAVAANNGFDPSTPALLAIAGAVAMVWPTYRAAIPDQGR